MLSSLLSAPHTTQEWQRWSLAHRFDHDLIRQTIQANGGPNLTQYQLDPIPVTDFPSWLERNQQSHIDFTSVIGLQNTDLSTLDPRNDAQLQAWIYVHWLEHQSAHQKLGI